MSGLASPVDFDSYGDYAPPPGAYVQRGDIATLTYPIDDRITDDGSSGFPAAAGRYHLDTILPGEYPGRTEHIHVKLQAPGKAVLTTQLYFPDVARNQQDSIFDPHLLVTMQNTPSGKSATFDFVTSG